MTRKRKNGASHKKETQIRTRLIELSMKVENFIYHKAPISEAEAEKFIREVESYKTECSKDKRSLQVIEKLTRCMTAIIAEYQEQGLNVCGTNDDSFDADDLRANAESPVYSLPDEDRTQFTQEVERPVTDTVNVITNTVFNDDDFDRTQYTQAIQNYVLDNNIEDSEVINLCDDNNFEKEDNSMSVNISTNIRSHINDDVDMHKALSNLSITDIIDDQMCTEVECSQSILNNYEEINKSQQCKTTILGTTKYNANTKPRTQAPVVSNDSIKVKPIVIKANNINTAFKKYNLNNPLVLKVSKAINNNFSVDKTIKSNQNNTAQTILEKENDIATTNPINYMQQKLTPTSNTNINNKTYDTSKIHNNISKTTENSKQVIETLHNCKRNVVKENPVLIKRKRGPRKKKETQLKANYKETVKLDSAATHLNSDINNPTIKTAPKKTYTRKKINDKSQDASISIYNDNVENDLSWLEGIRFVREIGEDECDHNFSNLNENFWDNYYLPPNFDDNDFL